MQAVAPTIPDHKILRCIGQGSYGEVWLARTALGAFRAVKVLRRDRFESQRPYDREFDGIRRFEPISRTHEGFLDVLHVGRSEAGDWFYYVMELADDATTSLNPNAPDPAGPGSIPFDPTAYEAKTLSAVLRRRERLPVADCVRVGLALTAALEHLHRHDLIHRDIKPSNIVFVDSQPKLADVGLVADTSEAHSFVGTPGFMPSEGWGTVQADLYALGKLLYAASTGHSATAWPNPLTALEALPDQKEWLELNEVILKACDPVPKRRYASAAEMQVDLALLQSGKSLQRQRRLEKRLKQAGWAIAGLVGMGLAALLFQQVRVKAAVRSLLLLQLEKEIRPPHTEGWSGGAWSTASKAATRFGFDTNLQSQAAASLAGLDAKLIFLTNGPGGSSVAFDRNGKRILFSSLPGHTHQPGKVRVLDLATGKTSSYTFPGEGPAVLLPDDTLVQLSADRSNRLALWRLSPAPDFGDSGPQSPPGGEGLRGAGDGLSDATGRTNAQPAVLCRFNLAATDSIAPIEALALTSGGMFVAASGVTTNQAFCAVCDAASDRLMFQTNLASSALALTPDGSLLAAGNEAGEVTVWRVKDGSPLGNLTAGRNPIQSLSFCRDLIRTPGQPEGDAKWLLAVGDSNSGVTIWDLPARRLRARCLGARYGIDALAFSPDGTLLASAGRLPIILWDAATGHPVVSIPCDQIIGLDFSTDGRNLATANRAGAKVTEARIWTVESGRGIRTLRGLSHQITKACFSADASLLAAVADDWQVGIWNLSSHRLLHVLNMPRGLVTADNAGLAFSPDGSQFGFMAGTNAMLIDVHSGNLTRRWRMPPGFVDELAFDPSGHLLAFHVEPTNAHAAAFSRPTTVRIRDLASMEPHQSLIELPEFDKVVHKAVWSPKASFVMVEGVGSQGGQLKRMVKAVSPRERRVLWSRESTQNPSSASYLCVDAAGSLVTAPHGPYASELCESLSGKGLRMLSFAPEALNSAAGLVCFRTPSAACALHSLRDGSGLVAILPSEFKPSSSPVLSGDGERLAWGNEDGTVSVCEITQLRQHLATLKLGW